MASENPTTAPAMLRTVRMCDGAFVRGLHGIACRVFGYHHWIDTGSGWRDHCSVCGLGSFGRAAGSVETPCKN